MQPPRRLGELRRRQLGMPLESWDSLGVGARQAIGEAALAVDLIRAWKISFPTRKPFRGDRANSRLYHGFSGPLETASAHLCSSSQLVLRRTSYETTNQDE